MHIIPILENIIKQENTILALSLIWQTHLGDTYASGRRSFYVRSSCGTVHI